MSGSEPVARPELPRGPVDLRLLPVVAGLWTAQAGVIWRAPRDTAAGALGTWLVVGGLVIAAGLVIAGWGTRGSLAARRCGHGRGRPIAVLIGFALVGAGLGLVGGATHLARSNPELLVEARQARAVAEVQVRITGDPRESISRDERFAGRSTWSVVGRVEQLTLRGRDYALRSPVVLRGPQARDLPHGSVVRVRGRVQPPWAGAPVAATIGMLGPASIRSPPGPVATVTNTIRSAFSDSVAGLDADAGALLLGLAVGDESRVSPELDEAMIRAGLAHLTAVSGSNTALVVALTLAVVAALGSGWRTRITACSLVLAGYVLLVRPQPSVLRAAAMGAVALLALGTGGRRQGTAALLGACLLLLVGLPELALSIGFALSVAATAGLLMAGPPLVEMLARARATRWLPSPVRTALAVALAAHLATLPLAVGIGNGASLVALPANVLVTPAVPVATVLGLAAALSAPMLPGLAQALALVASPFTGFIAAVAHWGSAVPHGVLATPGGAGAAVRAACLLGVLVAVLRHRRLAWAHRGQVGSAVVAVVVAVGAVHWWRDSRWPPASWVVLACDVGQGDAVVLRRAGSDVALLVDVGPDPRVVAECLSDAGVARVAAVLLSHFHADHVDGLSGVLDGWPVEHVLMTGTADPPDAAARVTAQARAAGATLRVLRAGDRIVVAGIDVRVLWPARRIEESPANNASVVALANIPTSAGPVRVLLPGDIEPEAQAALLGAPGPAAAVVKVPHHGSAHQLPAFAAWTGAAIALVTVGRDNDYGHPSPRTLGHYVDAGAIVGRTDQQGGLAVVRVGELLGLVAQR